MAHATRRWRFRCQLAGGKKAAPERAFVRLRPNDFWPSVGATIKQTSFGQRRRWMKAERKPTSVPSHFYHTEYIKWRSITTRVLPSPVVGGVSSSSLSCYRGRRRFVVLLLFVLLKGGGRRELGGVRFSSDIVPLTIFAPSQSLNFFQTVFDQIEVSDAIW